MSAWGRGNAEGKDVAEDALGRNGSVQMRGGMLKDGKEIPWEALKFDENGLIPAIVQDAQSKEILMMAYMNRESLQRSLETGETWFWSRSRNALWHKGATSGNTQKIVSVAYDCDGDTLLFKVIPAGPACHEGTYTCFTRPLAENAVQGRAGAQSGASQGSSAEETRLGGGRAEAFDRFAIFNRLEETIAKREAERPEGSYTTYLFEKGLDKILKKIGEEAGEVIIAAKNRSHEELRWEISDLLYHLLVLLREQKLPLDDVLTELASRHK
ncbi:bifunctional phosphoribosyl-AMP cyclohydrolase/phosphoribosyl-ATP diphosphatase HisIE [Bacillaceae bacterium]